MTRLKRLLFRIRLWKAGEWERGSVYARELGIKIGTDVRITGDVIFGSEPYLISLGDNVTLTQNVTFVTHDGGVAVFRKEHPGLNVFGKIRIGNNVFIGAGSILMPGISIGDNVVVGAGSVVTKDIPPNVVAVGVPARVLKSLDQYREQTMEKGVIIKSKDPAQRRREIEGLFGANK